MSESVHLVPGHGSHHVVEMLTQLLQAAEAGQIRGLIFAVSIRGSERFYCDSAGSLYRDPVKALGANVMLQNELMGLIRRRDMDSVF